RDQQWGAFAVGVVEHAHGIAQATAGVEIHQTDLAGGHREAVGHRHDRNFLQAENVPGVMMAGGEGVVQRQLGRAWVAEDIRRDDKMKERIDSEHRLGHGPVQQSTLERCCQRSQCTGAGDGINWRVTWYKPGNYSMVVALSSVLRWAVFCSGGTLIGF